MGLNLFKKYFVATAAIFLLTLTVMMMILTFVYNDYLADSKFESLDKACATVADFTKRTPARNETGESDGASLQNLQYVIRTIGQAAEYDLLICDTDGKILICSCDEWLSKHSCIHSSSSVSDAVLKKSLKNADHGMESIGIYEEPHYVAYSPIVKPNGESIGCVFAAAPITSIRPFLTSMTRLYLLSAIFPIIMMFFLLYAINYRLTKPLRLMSAATKAMAKGDFSKRIPVTGDDEIGELAVSFNRMTNSLAQLEGMRRSFVANVSHELKTPMTTISGFIDGIIDGTIEPDKQTYYLNIVSEEVKRLSRLVESMLNIAKLESGEMPLKPENFNFRELLLQVVIGQEQRIEQKKLEIKGLDELQDITLYADKDLLHQVVYNLVDNAIKFTPDGGTIDFNLRADGKKLIFTLRNTGKGIPNESLSYVFERFYKVDKSRSANKNSTGLGLYIVKTIVHSHGGTVTVSSRENEMTVFEVILPINK